MSTDSFMAVLSNIMHQRAPKFDNRDAANYRSLKHLCQVKCQYREKDATDTISNFQNKSTHFRTRPETYVCRTWGHSLTWSNHTITLEVILQYFRPPSSTFGMTWVVAFSSDRLNANQPVVLALLTGPVWSRCVDVLSSRWQVFYLTPDKQMFVSMLRKTRKESQAEDWSLSLSRHLVLQTRKKTLCCV